MSKLKILILCLVLLPNLHYGQHGNFISIPELNEIQGQFSKDTARINYWLAKTSYLLSSNLPDSALSTLRKAYPLIMKYNLEAKQLEASSLFSTYFQYTGELDKAISMINFTLRKAKTINNEALLIQFHNIAAINYKQVGSYANSVWHYFQALDIIEKHDLNNTFQAVQTTINLGIVWRRIGEEKQALNLLHKAKSQIIKNLDKKSYEGVYPYVLVNIGLVYFYSQPDTALYYFEKAMKIAKLNKQHYVENFALYKINYVYLEQGKYDLVLHYLQHAETTAYFKTDISKIQINYLSGRLYLKLRQPQKAVKFLSEALRLSEKTKSKELIVGIYQDLNKAYVDLNQYRQAHLYQEKLLTYIGTNQENEKKASVNLLYENQMAKKEIENNKTKFDLQLKEKKIREKNIYIGVSIMSFVFLLLLSLQRNNNNKTKERLQEEKFHNFEKKQEIEKLKAIAEGEERERMRIAYELHDGIMVKFATVKMQLNTLPYVHSTLQKTASYKELITQFDKATKELRSTAHNLMPDLLLQEGIGHALYYFCKTVQESSKLPISFLYYDKHTRFQQEFEVSVYRMIQELIQNIIKHANATKAIVQLNHINNLLSITVEDNGGGFNINQTKNSLGLKGIQNRVRIFNGYFDIKTSSTSGTTVFLEFDTQLLII